MKYIYQFGVIIVISFIGEILNNLIPLPIPASIYGLVIMFICLYTKILKVNEIKETGTFLIEVMPLMFIPAAVGLLESWTVLQPVIIPVSIIVIVSTIIVMYVSATVTQSIIRGAKK